MRIDFVTIFPRMLDPFLAEGVIARGVKQKLLDIRVWDLRDFTSDRHRSTDDEAYGGGPGMVMLAEPVIRCVDAIRENKNVSPQPSSLIPHLIMTTPQGRRFDQDVARELSARLWLVFLCGRYEGFDERVRQALVRALLQSGEHSEEALSGLLQSKDDKTREMAVRALAGRRGPWPWPWPWPRPRPAP